ncbi:hypothetical protein PG991_010196 [Apiospora marii]|uniref:Rhodopsin domain-containing protein n=1 Tax=Apiospora marii TaxID=335849 RepID=A0ABR1RHS8_9PEZI
MPYIYINLIAGNMAVIADTQSRKSFQHGSRAPPLDPALWNENKGPTIIAATSAAMAVSTLFVGTRIFVRAIVMRQMNLDDYLIMFSVVCGWMAVGFSMAAIKSGYGRHIQTLTPDQLSGAVLYTMVGFIPAILTFVVPKLAVVCLLCRLLSPSKIHRRILWGSAIGCLIFMLGCNAIMFAQCTPSRSQWDFTLEKEHCWDPWVLVNYSRAGCSTSAFMDLYLAVYPATVLWQLHMKPKKKAALCGALGIGSIATVATIYKTPALSSLAHYDFTWATSGLTIWTLVEGSTIIIASCIPLFQPLLELILGRRAFGSSIGWKKYKRYSSDPNATNRTGGRSGHELSLQTRHRNARRQFDMESVLATTQNNGSGSRERILAASEDRHPASPKPDGAEPSSATESDLQRLGGIDRTDEVSISYARNPSVDDKNDGSRTTWN